MAIHGAAMAGDGQRGLAAAATVLLGVCVALPSPARAQSLSDFLRSARERNLQSRAAREQVLQSARLADEAFWTMFPTVSLSSSYTHNQFNVAFPLPGTQLQNLVILPQNQLNLTVRLDIPLFDPPKWSRYGAGKSQARAAVLREQDTALQVEGAVVRAYYQHLAANGLREAALRTTQSANETLEVARNRIAAGTASDLDAERAIAQVEQARQAVAQAEALIETTRRSLESLSGLEAARLQAPEDIPLAPEAPREVWEERAGHGNPGVRAAAENATAAELTAESAIGQLYPIVSGFATESGTNATSFVGVPFFWSWGIQVNWRFDGAVVSNAGAAIAAARVAQTGYEQELQNRRDAIHSAWEDVRAQITRAVAARAAQRASHRALELARQRYSAGTATQLDVLQANRDAFQADYDRLQADLDLMVSRAQLRVSAGQSPLAPGP